MKTKHIASLLQTGFTTVQVVFRASQHSIAATQYEAGRIPKPYTYKASLDDKLTTEDYVVVDTPTHGFVVAKVVGVDATPDLDLDADYDYKWIVQKVDPTKYQSNVAKEAAFNQAMQEVERARQRESIKMHFSEQFKDSTLGSMFDQAVASLNGPQDVE